jgi:hypothetical protein
MVPDMSEHGEENVDTSWDQIAPKFKEARTAMRKEREAEALAEPPLPLAKKVLAGRDSLELIRERMILYEAERPERPQQTEVIVPQSPKSVTFTSEKRRIISPGTVSPVIRHNRYIEQRHGSSTPLVGQLHGETEPSLQKTSDSWSSFDGKQESATVSPPRATNVEFENRFSPWNLSNTSGLLPGTIETPGRTSRLVELPRVIVTDEGGQQLSRHVRRPTGTFNSGLDPEDSEEDAAERPYTTGMPYTSFPTIPTENKVWADKYSRDVVSDAGYQQQLVKDPRDVMSDAGEQRQLQYSTAGINTGKEAGRRPYTSLLGHPAEFTTLDTPTYSKVDHLDEDIQEAQAFPLGRSPVTVSVDYSPSDFRRRARRNTESKTGEQQQQLQSPTPEIGTGEEAPKKDSEDKFEADSEEEAAHRPYMEGNVSKEDVE